MSLLEDIQNLESMSEEELKEYYGDDEGFFLLMFQDAENTFREVTEEEYDEIRDDLERMLADRAGEMGD
jgi:hypothetical protein